MQEGETGMADLFTLFGTIAICNDEANKAINSTTQKAESASQNIKKSFEKIGSAAVKCGKVIASGLAVGATAMGALMKASIGEYADYEQLVGGVETLFKDSKDKVLEYANSAYATAGMSANEYMEIVTGFSASLLQGLNGDTEKAAELANLALIDMADNTNKFGSDITSVQNAYQGFAKQNYTMLDNLKLGYGGTAAEMARLINDSGVLGAAIEITAETVKDVPFNKIIEAIHVTQQEMEITGTTAKEASDTISGSFASFKATWKNLLIGLASDEQNVDKLFANFTASGKTLAKNVISVIPSIIRNVKTVLASAAQFISEEWANTLWPKIQEFFKIKFGIELPDWETTIASIQEWWNSDKTAYEKLKEIFKWTLGMFIAPETDSFIGDIKLWWTETAQPSITKVTQWTFGQLVLPAWLDFVDNVTSWWQDNIEPKIHTLTTWKLGDIKFPSWSEIADSVKSWWDSIKSNFSKICTFYATYDVKRTYTREELDASDWEIDTTAGATTPVMVNANAEGAIFSRPTIFGTRLGYQMVGEAGAEAVAPIDKLQQYVSDAVRSTVGGMSFNIVLDSGALVGQLAPQMDSRLGTLAGRKGRGI